MSKIFDDETEAQLKYEREIDRHCGHDSKEPDFYDAEKHPRWAEFGKGFKKDYAEYLNDYRSAKEVSAAFEDYLSETIFFAPPNTSLCINLVNWKEMGEQFLEDCEDYLNGLLTAQEVKDMYGKYIADIWEKYVKED